MGQDVHTDGRCADVVQGLLQYDDGRERAGVCRYLMESCERRWRDADLSKLKMKVEGRHVRPDDMRALEVECKAAARITVSAKLSILGDYEKKRLEELAEAKQQAERASRRSEAQRDGEAIAKSILGESTKIDLQDIDREVLWKIESEEARQQLEERVKAEEEAEQHEDTEEQHAKQNTKLSAKIPSNHLRLHGKQYTSTSPFAPEKFQKWQIHRRQNQQAPSRLYCLRFLPGSIMVTTST